jgi:hypothetical protein
MDVTMLLGELIAEFDDPAFAGEAMLALDDLVLTARITAAATEDNISPGEFAMRAIGRFVNTASDEEWLTLIGLISKAGNPGQAFLQCILANSLAASSTA